MGGCAGAVRRVSRRAGAGIAMEEEMRTVGRIRWKRSLILRDCLCQSVLSKPDYRGVDLSTKTMHLIYLKSSRQNTLYIPKISGSKCCKEPHKPKANAGGFTSRIQKFNKNPPLRAG